MDMPIIDYHCHLPQAQIANDQQFENITQAWLYGDHYKWRAMRANGVDEKYITGNGTDFEKFQTLGRNRSLYHYAILCTTGRTWNCNAILELKRF